MNYGLIGNPLKHSFSKEIHAKLADYEYTLRELDEKSFDFFMREKNFKGINVTIPYKQKVIPYLDFIDEDAKSINAVNTIVNVDGKLHGYNTDILGVLATFEKFNINIQDKNVLILGTGATSNTLYYAVKKSSAKNIYKAYRASSKIKGDVLYEDIAGANYTSSHHFCDDIDIIINATPTGMFPHLDDPNLIDLSKFKNLEVVMDVVYNPLRTKLLIEAERLKIKAVSGLYMLVSQAYFASKLFTSTSELREPHRTNDLCEPHHIDKLCDSVYLSCLREKQNIVLTGMPTCGKSTVGRKLASKLEYNFIDTDKLIEEKTGMPTQDYITKNGIEKFRDIESEVIKEIAAYSKTVISTGGGSILKDENVINLKHNGKIYFMNRSIALLHPKGDRPLTSNYQSLKKIYDERLPMYKKACDKEIDGNLEVKERVNLIINDFS